MIRTCTNCGHVTNTDEPTCPDCGTAMLSLDQLHAAAVEAGVHLSWLVRLESRASAWQRVIAVSPGNAVTVQTA